MEKYLPEPVRTYVITGILALIPLLIANLMISPIFQNPELDLTLLEKKDEGVSRVFVIIQNTGNTISQNILITFVGDGFYELILSYGPDKPPIDITPEGKNLLLELERLAPNSYLILETKSILTGAKTVWVTSDETTTFLTLPYSESDTGISSINIMENREITFVGIAIFGFSALLIFRYINFNKSEYTRRKFLGIYPIEIVRYKSNYLTAGIIILFFGISGGWYVDNYLEPDPIKDYLTYKVFSVTDTIIPETFLQINDPSAPYSEGSIIAALAVLASLILSKRDIHLPKFVWSLSKPLSKIYLKDILSSYLIAEEISINTRKDLSKSESEIFVVKEKDHVIGLLSKKGADDLNLGKKPKLKKVFNEDLDWDHSKIKKNNFVVVNESLNLEQLKKQMESEGKIYAVIFDNENVLQGVVEYGDLFGKPENMR